MGLRRDGDTGQVTLALRCEVNTVRSEDGRDFHAHAKATSPANASAASPRAARAHRALARGWIESQGGVHVAGHGRGARLLDGALKLGHSAHEVDAIRPLTVQQQDLIAVP